MYADWDFLGVEWQNKRFSLLNVEKVGVGSGGHKSWEDEER